MFTDPVVLIDQTMDNLETLAALFEDETGLHAHASSEQTARAQRCRDAMRAIAFLLPKLRAARMTQVPQRLPRTCVNCD